MPLRPDAVFKASHPLPAQFPVGPNVPPSFPGLFGLSAFAADFVTRGPALHQEEKIPDLVDSQVS